MTVVAVLDWLGDNPWGGEIPWWEILITLFGVFGGAFLGGRTIAVSRVRAEARRELYADVLPLVLALPANVRGCRPWLSACLRAQLVSEMLSWPERRGWQSLERHLPWNGKRPFSLPTLESNDEYDREIQRCAVAFRSDGGFREENDLVLEQTYGASIAALCKKFERSNLHSAFIQIESYIGRKLRPGLPWRRAMTFWLGALLIWKSWRPSGKP